MKIKELSRRALFTALAGMQLLFFPVYSSAPAGAQETDPPVDSGDTTSESTDDGTPPPPPVPVEPPLPPRPPGADANVFEWNEATETWESFLYSYDPVTRVRAMKSVPTVRYNFDTSMWEVIDWSFSAPSQTYFWYPVSSHTSQPSGLVMGAVPNTNAYPQNAGGSGGGTSVSNTGPGSNANINNTTNNNSDVDINNSADFNIVLDLLAQSGNAAVLGNNYGGSASSGNADSSANVLNQIQSQWDINDILTFSTDLYGDIYGDLLVNTTNLGPDSDIEVNNEVNNAVDIDVNNDTTIFNDIDVVAQTGDATVSGNTTGGDATTGDANAFANIINMINSSIDSGANFMGTLNIHGEFDGDILFPTGELNNLISNTGPDSEVEINNSVNNEANVDVNTDTSIANNIVANASSGDAVVSGNTTGGDATSGNATSNVNMLNLSGQDVISENTLLVFINVLGEWVGVLMDAPMGTTAATIGSGASVTSNNAVNNNLDYTENNDTQITNNVNVQAHSGDATVSGNTTGGDATTGDANAAVNVANLVNTQVSASSWFGVLFINVFGTWNGSFNVDTAAGDNPPAALTSNYGAASLGAGGQGGEGTLVTDQPPQEEPNVRVYGFSGTSDGGFRASPIASSALTEDVIAAAEEAVTKENSDSVLSDVGEAIAGEAAPASSGEILGLPTNVVVVSFLAAGAILGNRLLFAISSRRS